MKKIKVAVCIDDNGGVLLFGKRQSRDRTLIADFVKTVGEGCVYVNQFSKALFTSYPEVNVCESPQDEAPDGCAVFAENIPRPNVIQRNSIRKRSLPPCERATEVMATYCATLQKRLPIK